MIFPRKYVRLFAVSKKTPGERCSCDTMTRSVPFTMPEERRYAFLEGLDEYGMLLRLRDDVRAFQERDRPGRPWIYYRLPQHSL